MIQTAIILLAALMAILIHELGHIGTACALSARVIRVGLDWKGPYVVREPCTPAKCIAIAAAGPVANLVTAFGCLCVDWGWELCVISLAMAVVSLLPIPGSDGWRIANTVLSQIAARDMEWKIK